LTVKPSLIFGKQFTVSKIKLFVFARTFDIRLPEFGNARSLESKRHWNLATSDRQNPATSGHRHQMPTDQIPAETGRNPAGSDRIRPLIRPDLAQMAWIRPDLTRSKGVRTESGNGDRTLLDSGDSCNITSRNFFVRTKRRKIFSRKLFFLKMISSKIFYDGNHFTSKQTEH